ncbi:hypothetical protein [Mucisphaera calidilacus]|uniref:Uncharacterized protein n=1 Tax=Mucisphaera calidilacus TaxID=2527982 RepID=A0A518BUF8_9BACT|nr:hypothetical protein [Mucisphaera calidilacus]QDU70596.1 hypothetical protein Pan265_04240 [Mucisphaera calidilacus]
MIQLRRLFSPVLWALTLTCLCLCLLPASEATADTTASGSEHASITYPPQVAIDAYKSRLLDVAMSAASKMPIVVHLKNRSRSQYKVFRATLDHDQVETAREYLTRIDNWRRGAAAADFAYYCADHGFPEPVASYLRLAKASSLLATQDWQRDYIELTMANTQLVLGQKQLAETFREGLTDDVFRGQLEITESRLSDEQQYETMMERLDVLLDTNRYEVIVNGAQAYAQLYEKHYADGERRQTIENKLRVAYKDMPGPETIDLLLMLVQTALEHEDRETALRLLRDTDVLFAETQWPSNTEYAYQFESRIVQRYADVGESALASTRLAAMAKRYEEEESEIVDISRAEAIQAIAEGYAGMGHLDLARLHYQRALDAGFVNPNGRPRAEDLVAVCLSMARFGVEPDDELWDLIQTRHDELGTPW